MIIYVSSDIFAVIFENGAEKIYEISKKGKM